MIKPIAMDLIQKQHIDLYDYLQNPTQQKHFLYEFKAYLEHEVLHIINELESLETAKNGLLSAHDNVSTETLIAIKNLFNDILLYAVLFDTDLITATHSIATPHQFNEILEQIWEVHNERVIYN